MKDTYNSFIGGRLYSGIICKEQFSRDQGMKNNTVVHTKERLFYQIICRYQFIKAQYEASHKSSYWRETEQCTGVLYKKFERRFILERVYNRVTFVVSTSAGLNEKIT